MARVLNFDKHNHKFNVGCTEETYEPTIFLCQSLKLAFATVEKELFKFSIQTDSGDELTKALARLKGHGVDVIEEIPLDVPITEPLSKIWKERRDLEALVIGVPFRPGEEELRLAQFNFFKRHGPRDEYHYETATDQETLVGHLTNPEYNGSHVYILSHGNVNHEIVFPVGNPVHPRDIMRIDAVERNNLFFHLVHSYADDHLFAELLRDYEGRRNFQVHAHYITNMTYNLKENLFDPHAPDGLPVIHTGLLPKYYYRKEFEALINERMLS
eukprot:TRINITY_DN225_c0_g1_i2.p1 TRINITY_DN225_c0_g1~~TRINITY_DN225_c0_g1_i2.p1  ORF type:complete len:282 (-),score=25.09 TRINITY_DN225_c0_g1_i2:107-919(-)